MNKIKLLFYRILCTFGFHDPKPSSLSIWESHRVNFQCTRCGVGWRKYNDIKKKKYKEI